MTLGDRLRERFDEVGDLPTLSPVVAELAVTLRRDDVGLGEIEAIIRRDPVVVARVLSAANAAVYAAHAPATSLRGALLRLGLARVRRLALLFSLYNAVPARAAVQESFWAHSVRAAYAAEALARRASVQGLDPDVVFLAALLHDIGLLVLASHYARDLAAARSLAERRTVPLWEAEMALLGIEHGEIGGRLVEYWSLPKELTAAIQYHHRVDMAPRLHQVSAGIIRLADGVCAGEEDWDLGEGTRFDADDRVLASLGLDETCLLAIVEEARTETRNVIGLLTVTP